MHIAAAPQEFLKTIPKTIATPQGFLKTVLKTVLKTITAPQGFLKTVITILKYIYNSYILYSVQRFSGILAAL